jgi:hypothetical protein
VKSLDIRVKMAIFVANKIQYKTNPSITQEDYEQISFRFPAAKSQ